MAATIEHIVNRSDGGSSYHTNTVLTCYRCNNKRAARESQARRRYGLEKWVRRRLRHFRMDHGGTRWIRVVVRGDRLKLLTLGERPVINGS